MPLRPYRLLTAVTIDTTGRERTAALWLKKKLWVETVDGNRLVRKAVARITFVPATVSGSRYGRLFNRVGSAPLVV